MSAPDKRGNIEMTNVEGDAKKLGKKPTADTSASAAALANMGGQSYALGWMREAGAADTDWRAGAKPPAGVTQGGGGGGGDAGAGEGGGAKVRAVLEEEEIEEMCFRPPPRKKK